MNLTCVDPFHLVVCSIQAHFWLKSWLTVPWLGLVYQFPIDILQPEDPEVQRKPNLSWTVESSDLIPVSGHFVLLRPFIHMPEKRNMMLT